MNNSPEPPRGRSETDAVFDAAVHVRMVAGDVTVLAELFNAYGERIKRRLRQRFPELPDLDMLHDAVMDALLAYFHHPDSYDPDKLPLLSYLTMSARGDLLNAIDRRSRQQDRESSLEAVEETPSGRNTLQKYSVTPTVDEVVEANAPVSLELLQAVRKVIPDPRDREMMKLIIENERRTAPYARILQIEHLGKSEQESTVKRHKDRLKKRLRRLKGTLDDLPTRD